MIQILFIATTIYVAYVFYSVSKDSKSTTSSTTKTNTNATTPTPKPVVHNIVTPPAPTPVEEIQTAEAVEADTKTDAVVIDSTNESLATAANVETDTETHQKVINLRNPLTGEISKANVSYLFTKRWIKEALVTEGLLDKVYSQHELNPELNNKVKQAFATLKTFPQYQVSQ